MTHRPRHDLSPHKLAHCEAVSKAMWEEAAKLGWSQEDAERASLLGFVHDFGRAFTPDGHSETGATILESAGYDMSFEVRNHGRLVDDPTPMLAMLWHADMTCDHHGNRCAYEDRLASVRERYGNDSRQAEGARHIIDWLNDNYPRCARRHQDERNQHA